MVVTSDRIDIDRQQVLHNIGHGADCKLSARIASLINENVESAYQLIEPSYSCVIRDIEWVQRPHVVVEASIAFRSEVIARLLEQCEKVAVFLVTIGGRLEEMAHQLAEDGLILQATVLDAIGSVAAEKVADFVQGRIAEIANERGLIISPRFSPGYCDWDIGQQRTVFEIVNGDSVEVSLTDGCLMLPRKSISGIVGIGSPSGNVESYNHCKTCDRKYDCPGRR